MRNRAAAWMAVVALAAGVAPMSAGAAEDGELTIRGRASGYVDIRVTKPVTLDLEAATFVGGGPYTAFFVDQIQPRSAYRVMLGMVDRAAAEDPGNAKPVTAADPGARLPVGTYRFYLLGSGIASVTIPVEGLGRSRTVTPRTPVTVNHTDAPLVASLSPGADAIYHAESRLPVMLSPRVLVYQKAVARFDGPSMQQHGVTACLQEAPSDPCDYELEGTSHAVTGWTATSYTGAAIGIGPKKPVEAVAKFRGSRMPSRAHVTLLTVPLSTSAPKPRLTIP